ncbi:hypothetical protein ES677_06165 [Bizionia gelidisalsuginis]|uniref:Integral membrane protein n=1 Tax=Bizionia gelidisalsuginis TaxID=291188 RepID=A0ABY3MBE5_9FLAO|nr:hypothetical protein [Bizionia gelidisalsuginis]TYC14123.1 hypothetical protein ES677_06165 [Bizionia gelidisalsuginis]
MKVKNSINTISAIILALFALLTLFLSSAVIFDWFGIRAKEGNYVLFIVWANFICSILYLFAAYGFITKAKWTFSMLIAPLVILIVAFIVLQFYINSGGIYETKTVKALIFRILVTLTFSLVAFFNIKNSRLKTKTKV